MTIEGKEAALQSTENPIPPVPLELLKLLLTHLGSSVQAGALQNAYQSQLAQNASSPLEQVQQIFNELGIKGVQVNLIRFARFNQQKLPVIVYHEDTWTLLERSDASLRTTRDGEHHEVCQENELQNAWALWINLRQRQQTSLFDKSNPARSMVLEEMFRSKRWLLDISVATVVVNVLAVSTALFAMQVYDRVVPTLAYATLWTLVAGMIVVISLDWFLKVLRARIVDSLASAIDKAISQRVFQHVLSLQLDLRPQSLGTLAAQVTGLDSVRQFFSSGIVFVLIDMPFAIMFIALIFVIGGSVGWVYLILLPIALALGLISQMMVRRLFEQQLTRTNERQGLLVESLNGMETIRATNATWRFTESWRDITQSIAGFSIKQKAISSFTSTSAASLASIAYVSAIVVGVNQIAQGFLTMGGLIACSILGGRVIAPIAQGVQYLSQWQSVSQSLQLVNQVLAIETERPADKVLLRPDRSVTKLALEEVRFSYPESPIAQLNIKHLTFEAGERVAILGEVGSGKSTLLKVLTGLFKPSSGRVRLGDADLWEMDPNLVAEQIGYLPQTTHLFKGTLRSNIALSGTVSDSSLIEVCKALGIDNIARDNPKGLDLPISEGGDGLSGGQRQLVGLARVITAKPSIWLLDEPAAWLDQNSEDRVLAAVRHYVKPQDILITTTHRPMRLAGLVDRMIVMKHGEVALDGTPEAVMARIQSERVRSNSRTSSNNQDAASQGGTRLVQKGSTDVI